MSAYRIAIDSITQTIQQRARYYRNLVVVVSITIMSSFAWSMIVGQFRPLISLILLFPICGFFFFLDSNLLNKWRSQLFQQWVRKELEFRYFLDTMRAMITLPKGTVEGMLSFLPTDEDLLKGQRLSFETRQTVAMLVSTLDSCRASDLALKTVGYAVTAVLVIVATNWWLWQPMIGLLGLPLLFIVAKLFSACPRTPRIYKEQLVTFNFGNEVFQGIGQNWLY